VAPIDATATDPDVVAQAILAQIASAPGD